MEIVKHAENIGRQFGIKKVFGLILRNDDVLAYHTRCILCGHVGDIDCDKFIEQPEFQVSCRKCGATLSYNTNKQPRITPPIDPKPEPPKKPPVTSKPKTEGIKSKKNKKRERKDEVEASQPKAEEPKPAEPKPEETPKLTPQAKSAQTRLDTVTDLYEDFVGEMINGRKIICHEYNGKVHYYQMKCEECGTIGKVACSRILNSPDTAPSCRCAFTRLGIHKPEIGEVRNAWEVTDVYKRRQWHVDVKCIACGFERKGLYVKEWLDLGPDNNCRAHLDKAAKQSDSDESAKEDVTQHFAITPPTSNRNMVKNPNFKLPGIITKGDKELIDSSDCPQLYSVYRNMIARAKELKVPVCLKWYDDDFPVNENVDGFTSFYMWSMRNGYCTHQGVTGVNIARLTRKDLAFGFDEDNCQWTFLGT